MSEAIIKIQNMNKWFGDFQVLKDINLEVKPKEKIVVCGPSGSGKSTLINYMKIKFTDNITFSSSSLINENFFSYENASLRLEKIKKINSPEIKLIYLGCSQHSWNNIKLQEEGFYYAFDSYSLDSKYNDVINAHAKFILENNFILCGQCVVILLLLNAFCFFIKFFSSIIYLGVIHT